MVSVYFSCFLPVQNECFIATTEAEGLEGPCPSAAQEQEVHPGSVHCEIYLRLPFPAFVSPVYVEINKTDTYLWRCNALSLCSCGNARFIKTERHTGFSSKNFHWQQLSSWLTLFLYK